MDMVRHATQGRLSELFKRDMFDTDIFLRALGMSEKSRLVLEKEDPAILATLQAYADGVNAWITECGNKLPPEFRVLGYKPEPWTMMDITNIIGFIGWDLALQISQMRSAIISLAGSWALKRLRNSLLTGIWLTRLSFLISDWMRS